jgi:hypothetical protein
MKRRGRGASPSKGAASGSPRLRLVTALASLGVGAVFVARVADESGNAARLTWVIGLTALALQTLTVTRWPGAAMASGALLGTLGGLALFPAANRDTAVEIVVLFLATIELAGWSAQLRSVIPETPDSVRRRLGEVGAIVAGGGLVSAAMLGAAQLEGPRGRVALVVGLGAAVVPVALLTARRWRAG